MGAFVVLGLLFCFPYQAKIRLASGNVFEMTYFVSSPVGRKTTTLSIKIHSLRRSVTSDCKRCLTSVLWPDDSPGLGVVANPAVLSVLIIAVIIDIFPWEYINNCIE